VSRKRKPNNVDYDLRLLSLGLIGGFFLGLSSSASYDFFIRLLELNEGGEKMKLTMSFIFMVLPLVLSFILFRQVFQNVKNRKND